VQHENRRAAVFVDEDCVDSRSDGVWSLQSLVTSVLQKKTEMTEDRSGCRPVWCRWPRDARLSIWS